MEEMKKTGNVHEPIHYRGDGTIQCMDAMRSMMTTVPISTPPIVLFWWGCAFKYVWRWIHKGGVEDIDKAIECLENMKRAAEGVTHVVGRL